MSLAILILLGVVLPILDRCAWPPILAFSIASFHALLPLHPSSPFGKFLFPGFYLYTLVLKLSKFHYADFADQRVIINSDSTLVQNSQEYRLKY